MTYPLGWDSTVWDAINRAVYDEAQRTKIARKIIPINLTLGNVSTVPSDILLKDEKGNGFRISEGDITALIEVSVKFVMTTTQIQQERAIGTGVTLATKSANLLSLLEDQIIFQGSATFDPDVVEVETNGNKGKGLLGDPKVDPRTIITVPQSKKDGQAPRYGENTFKAVADGIALLQSKGHYGAYALVLNFREYADTFAPLKDTLIMPADRIKPLVDKGFYGTDTIPPKRGVLFSVAGNTMDLTIGVDASADFRNLSSTLYLFRVFQKSALRLRDKSAVIRLEFE